MKISPNSFFDNKYVIGFLDLGIQPLHNLKFRYNTQIHIRWSRDLLCLDLMIDKVTFVFLKITMEVKIELLQNLCPPQSWQHWRIENLEINFFLHDFPKYYQNPNCYKKSLTALGYQGSISNQEKWKNDGRELKKIKKFNKIRKLKSIKIHFITFPLLYNFH